MKSASVRTVLIVLTFLSGIALAHMAWWQNDPYIIALPALIPFFYHLRSGGG